MCLIFLALQDHPQYKLILAANRDEFYKRAASPVDFWSEAPQVLAGRDLEAGGTWLGMTTEGRLSLLTNYRDLKNLKSNAPSRGELVSGYLKGDASPAAYVRGVEQKGAAYNGFNLLAGSPEEMWYVSNYGRPTTMLPPGTYALSNHLLDTPWPKVTRLKKSMAPILSKNVIDVEHVFEILCDDQRADDAALPDTGVGLERERALSSMFITMDGYGTRCSTVILVDRADRVTFAERTYDRPATTYQTRVKNFTIGRAA